MFKKIVWLDAGHGGSDSGAVGFDLHEKDITLKICNRVGEILTAEYNELLVKYTRVDDIFVSLSDRADRANKANANVFISFHINAGKGTGYEDFIHDKTKNVATKELQNIIHKYASEVCLAYGLKDRGKQSANYAVLRLTNMKAILVETGFIDTEYDSQFLKSEEFIENICQAYATAIAESLDIKKQINDERNFDSSQKNFYQVQVGFFSSKINALELKKKLKLKGFESYLVKNENFYSIQAGAFLNKDKAKELELKLKKEGFEVLIK